MQTTIGKTTLRLVTGDIADQDTDAVVTGSYESVVVDQLVQYIKLAPIQAEMPAHEFTNKMTELEPQCHSNFRGKFLEQTAGTLYLSKALL